MEVYCVIRCAGNGCSWYCESLEEIFLNQSDAENYIEQLELYENDNNDYFDVQEFLVHEQSILWSPK